MFFILAVVLFSCNHVYSLQQDYYWREYTGTIPQDAVVGGQDINGKDVYIGQAYIKDKGLIVVQISEGVREVGAPVQGIKKVDKYIKILCGAQMNFYWTAANFTNLQLSLIKKNPVIGGHEDGGGLLNVGRINFENGIVIGKINAWSTDNAYFYFNNKGQEKRVNMYEILLFNDNNVDVRINEKK